MKEVSFKVSKEDAALIGKIRDRACALHFSLTGKELDVLGIDMDLTAVYASGCPLDLDKLLGFDDANFGHDVFGIHRFLNRKTGELGGQFLPRCARS